jgi:hypothetical protein
MRFRCLNLIIACCARYLSRSSRDIFKTKKNAQVMGFVDPIRLAYVGERRHTSLDQSYT